MQFAKETYEHPQIVLLQKLCIKCSEQIRAFEEFRKRCIESDNYLREVIGELLLNATENSHDIHYYSDNKNELILNATEELDDIQYYSDSKDDADHGIEYSKAIPFDQYIDESSTCQTDVLTGEDSNANRCKGQKKNRKDYNIACEICGKTYTKGDMKFHLNSHYGNNCISIIDFGLF